MSDQGDSGAKDKGGPGAKPPVRSDGNPAFVALRMDDITLWVIDRVAKMPREHKFALGAKPGRSPMRARARKVDLLPSLARLGSAFGEGALDALRDVCAPAIA